MEWINCLIWTFSQCLCPTAFHTLQEWFYPYKKMVIQLASRRTLCSCCLSHWVVYVVWCNYFCSKVTGKQYQDNAIRLFARFVGGGRRDRWHFRLLQCCVLLTFHVVQNQNAVDHYECQNDQISFYVIHLILVEVQTKADYMPAVHA